MKREVRDQVVEAEVKKRTALQKCYDKKKSELESKHDEIRRQFEEDIRLKVREQGTIIPRILTLNLL